MNTEQLQSTPGKSYGIAFRPDQLPCLTITQAQIDQEKSKLPLILGPAELTDGAYFKMTEEFLRQRIVYVHSNETLLLRFMYDYEIDLEEIQTEGDLLRWALHLCDKNWMNTHRLAHFIEAVADIKGLNIYGL